MLSNLPVAIEKSISKFSDDSLGRSIMYNKANLHPKQGAISIRPKHFLNYNENVLMESPGHNVAALSNLCLVL